MGVNFPRGGARILVAEDDPVHGEALTDLLRREGHAVHLVMDGQQAIDHLVDGGDRLDLVMTDLLLPKRSGFDVVKTINELGLDVRVLAMTGVYENSRELLALRGMGVAGYLHKSNTFEHLLFRVNNLLYPQRDNTRANYRVAVSVPVQFKLGERVSYGTSYNLSYSGIYVRTHETALAGAIVEVSLGLPTCRQMVRFAGEVMHSASPNEVRGTAYPAGFGARFDESSPLARAALRAYVDAVHREEELGEYLSAHPYEQVEEEELVGA